MTYLPVGKNGIISLEVGASFHTHIPVLALISPQDLEAAMRPDTSLVSIMTVNNEIGVCQPVKTIGRSNKRCTDVNVSVLLVHR